MNQTSSSHLKDSRVRQFDLDDPQQPDSHSPIRPAELRSFARRLRSMSTTTDLLHELMGFGHFEQMTMTRDGLLIGQLRGCVGFDAFIGSPSRQMLERTAQLWSQLAAAERDLVLLRLAEQGIPPDRVGIHLETETAALVPLVCREKCV